MKSMIDKCAAVELELYAENTRTVYDFATMPTIKNLKKKYDKGMYAKDKAMKAWEYVATFAAKEYAKEFAKPSEWYTIFNAATRRAVATQLEGVYFDEYIK